MIFITGLGLLCSYPAISQTCLQFYNWKKWYKRRTFHFKLKIIVECVPANMNEA